MNTFNRKLICKMYITTILSCYAYYLMEWLFFYTRPSIFNYISLLDKLEILLTSPLLLIIISSVVFLLLTLLSISLKRIKYINKSEKYLPLLVPIIIYSLISYLLMDNFTHVFFGISTFSASNRLSKFVYLFLFLFLLSYFLTRVVQGNSETGFLYRKYKVLKKLTISLLILSTLSLFTSHINPIDNHLNIKRLNTQTKKYNILFLNADGVNSKNMSIYGYFRNTTPFLKKIKNELIIYNNHFTNSSKTTGSVGSLLNGKYPTRTGVIFKPDTFSGKDMYQHLPGILRKLGYYNIDISLRYYVDSNDLKMRNAFHYANNRIIKYSNYDFYQFFVLRWPKTVEFLEATWERLFQRLFHLTGYKTISNIHMIVTKGNDLPEAYSDRNRIDQLKHRIINSPKPFFANVHLLGPHGPLFSYENPIFTKSKKQNQAWMIDHYDNAIYQWDTYIKEIYDFLDNINELDKTIIVLNSDHGLQHSITNTLPLIMRYPNNTITGIKNIPSQRIDIAPTILSYLGIEVPAWMDGYDLNHRNNNGYPIFISSTNEDHQLINIGGWKSSGKIEPPFYTLETLSMILCGNLYSINVSNVNAPIISSVNLFDKKEKCKDTESYKPFKMIVTHLKEMKYNIPKALNDLSKQ